MGARRFILSSLNMGTMIISGALTSLAVEGVMRASTPCHQSWLGGVAQLLVLVVTSREDRKVTDGMGKFDVKYETG